MIIIYHGGKPFWPQMACRLHLARQKNGKSTVPFTVIGKDKQGNVICSLAYGRYHTVYERAILGICHIFNLNVRLVNVYELLSGDNNIAFIFRVKLFFLSWCPNLFFGYKAEVERILLSRIRLIQGG